METILVITYCSAVIYILYKIYNRYYRSDEDSDIEFQNISEQIEHLNELREQLQTIEEMITDVSICSPDEHEKVISCEWMNSLGNKLKYDLWVDGKNSTSEELLKIAYSERRRLRTSLKSEIKKLSERCNENCNENYSLSRGGGEQQ
jgi:hypothetical protein